MDKERAGGKTIWIIILTALCTALAMYAVTRVGDRVIPPERTTINIGRIEDTIRFVTTNKEVKPKIIRTGSTFTLDGKTISASEIVKKTNAAFLKNQILEDSLFYYKKKSGIYKDYYQKVQDSIHIYKSMNKFAKEKYGFYYTVKEGENNNYIYKRMNSAKIDSAMILYRLYSDRLKLNDGYWSILSDKEYRREQRRNN